MRGPQTPEQQALAELGLGEGSKAVARRSAPPARRAAEIPLAEPIDPTGKAQPFSKGWMLTSIAVFAAFQVAFGWAAATTVLKTPYLTENMRFFVEGSINLASYFLSGFVIGVVSPRVRLAEPALAAVIVVVATLSVGLFTPSRLMGMGPLKLLIGGGLAFVLALWGAMAGERLTRQLP